MAKFSLPFAKKINHSEFKLYINARILDPESGFDAIGYLLTKGDKIIDFQEGEPKLEEIACDEIIDCQNHLLCPALIDIQVHSVILVRLIRRILIAAVNQQLLVVLQLLFVNQILLPLLILLKF